MSNRARVHVYMPPQAGPSSSFWELKDLSGTFRFMLVLMH